MHTYYLHTFYHIMHSRLLLRDLTRMNIRLPAPNTPPYVLLALFMPSHSRYVIHLIVSMLVRPLLGVRGRRQPKDDAVPLPWRLRGMLWFEQQARDASGIL